MYFTSWIIFSVLIGFASLEEYSPEKNYEERQPRFGFFEPLRNSFCNNYCTHSETLLHVMKLFCAVKCPDLYLPHYGTPIQVIPPSDSSTPSPSMETSASSTATSSAGPSTMGSPTAGPPSTDMPSTNKSTIINPSSTNETKTDSENKAS